MYRPFIVGENVDEGLKETDGFDDGLEDDEIEGVNDGVVLGNFDLVGSIDGFVEGF